MIVFKGITHQLVSDWTIIILTEDFYYHGFPGDDIQGSA